MILRLKKRDLLLKKRHTQRLRKSAGDKTSFRLGKTESKLKNSKSKRTKKLKSSTKPSRRLCVQKQEQRNSKGCLLSSLSLSQICKLPTGNKESSWSRLRDARSLMKKRNKLRRKLKLSKKLKLRMMKLKFPKSRQKRSNTAVISWD
jgi:hypothetical protein